MVQVDNLFPKTDGIACCWENPDSDATIIDPPPPVQYQSSADDGLAGCQW
jgi:hypothetical protein